MKKYQLFLTYYSILISTSLFIWSFFHKTSPQGFLLTLLIIPICLYFWLLITGSFKTKPAENFLPAESRKQKIRAYLSLFLFTLFISSLSILFYSLIDNNHQSTNPKTLAETSKETQGLKAEKAYCNKGSYEDVTLELNQIKNELAKIRAEQKNQGNTVLGISDSPKQGSVSSTLPQGFITIRDGVSQTVPIYQEKSVTSKVVGKAQFGTSYLYTQKENDWYFISIGVNQEGWINGQFIKEMY